MLLAKINQRESDFSVAGAIHPAPEDVGGTYTYKNLQTRHRIPTLVAAREKKITRQANKAVHRRVSPSLKEKKNCIVSKEV